MIRYGIPSYNVSLHVAAFALTVSHFPFDKLRKMPCADKFSFFYHCMSASLPNSPIAAIILCVIAAVLTAKM